MYQANPTGSSGVNQIACSHRESGLAPNILEIVRKWNLSFNGARDNSAEEFLQRVSECRLDSSLADYHILSAMPSLLTYEALGWLRLYVAEKKWADWGRFIVAFRGRYGRIHFLDKAQG